MVESPVSDVGRPPPAVARWVAAVLCILYGFAKINGSQFTVLDSVLARPMGEVSGFWLTWYYFGYSPWYGTGLALLQIVAGVLLVLPRTALAGALLLLPIATNILLIDVFYGVDLSGTVAAAVLLICVLVIVVPYLPHLWAAVQLPPASGRSVAPRLAAVSVVFIGAFAFTWWAANHNNRAPTPIDGVWVVSSQQSDDAERRWRLVFFEYNRAHLVVFRGEDGPDVWHHFEVGADGAIHIWENWLRKGALIMEGRRTSDTEIELMVPDRAAGGRLVLHRVSSTP